MFVTHDQDEALELADRVAVMEHGEIVQYGPPHDVYDHPAAPSVYDFLGGANRIACRIRGGNVLVGELVVAKLGAPDDDAAGIFVRAHDLQILGAGDPAGLPAVVTRITLTGGSANVAVRLAAGGAVEVELPRWSLASLGVSDGQAVRLSPRRFGLFGPVAGAHPALSYAP